MLSYVWAFIVIFAACYSFFNGSSLAVSVAFLDGAKEAVTLVLSISGVMCVWSAVLELLKRGGALNALSKLLSPLLKALFPEGFKDEKTREYITGNISANFLGLGNAATPLGINATKQLNLLNPKKSVASDEMCMFVILNTASIQLIPSTVIAIRTSMGSVNPFDILPAAWLTSIISVLVGIFSAKLLKRVWKA